MKFHCDRCKTRYSIADERVRGKVLKIRCKNCSAVITVREERPPEPEAAASEPAPPDSDPDQPTQSAPPWFFAIGGIQHGPMALADAMAWLAKRERAERIFCWSVGFEDWLPVEEVEFFADLREPPAPGEEPNFEGETVEFQREGEPGVGGHEPAAGAEGAAAADAGLATSAGPVAEPASAAGSGASAGPLAEPLSAAGSGASASPVAEPAAAASATSAPTPAAGAAPQTAGAGGGIARDPAKGGQGAEGAGDPGMDFEFGEASRVVDVESLRAQAAAGMGTSSADPGQGAGAPFGSNSAAPSGPASPPLGGPSAPAAPGGWGAEPDPVAEDFTLKRRGHGLPIALAALVLAAAGAAAAIWYLSGSNGGEPQELTRSAMPEEELGHRVDIEPVKSESPGPDPGDEPGEESAPDPESERPGSGEPARGDRGSEQSAEPDSEREEGEETAAAEGSAADPLVGDGSEVELGGRDESSEEGEPIGPDDLLETYRSHQAMIDRCYTRALRRDPNLDVQSAEVTVTIDRSGEVSRVSIPSLEGTELGTCLESRIGGWSFRASPEPFTGEFRMMFGR